MYRKAKNGDSVTLGNAQRQVESAAALMKDIMENTKIIRVLMPKDARAVGLSSRKMCMQ